MKTHSLFLVLCAFVVSEVCSGQAPNSMAPGWGNLNFAVPTSPAFMILGVTPDNILRPSSVRDIAVSTGSYYLSNGMTIPKNLAVEICPSALNIKENLEDYQKYWGWYASSLSIGTKSNPDGSDAASVGLKFKLIDNGDLRRNSTLNKYINENLPTYRDAYDIALEIVKKKHGMNTKDIGLAYKNKPSITKEVNDVINGIKDTADISKFRDKMKDSLWNAIVLDVGIAGVLNSKDSIIQHISTLSKAGIWVTLGLPMGKKGQLLIGINGLLIDDSLGSLNQVKLNTGVRYYYGKNATKGFIQGECDFDQNFKSALTTIKGTMGIETCLYNGLWINFGIGLQKTGTQNVMFTPNLNINFGTPEKKITK